MRAKFGWSCGVALLALLGASWLLAHRVVEAPPPMEQVRRLIAERRYADARRAIEARLAEGDVEAVEREDLRFLLGHAHVLDGEAERARAAFAELEREFPDSRWSSKARYHVAELARARRAYEETAAIYRDRVADLISTQRKQEIAAIYRGFAREAEAKETPDWNAARTFYDLAVELGLSREQEREVARAAADAAMKLRDFRDAVQRWARLLKEHGDGPDGAFLLQLAEAERELGSPQARGHYEDLLRKHPGSPHRVAARIGIARTYGLPTPANELYLELGVRRLLEVVEQDAAHERAPEALFDVAQSAFHLGRFDRAAEELRRFVRSYGERAGLADRVGDAQIRLGECFERQGRWDDAIAAWRVFLGNHSFHPRWSEIQLRILGAEFARAEAFQVEERWDQARVAYQEFAGRYPLDARQPEILFRLGAMEESQKRFQNAIDEWQRLISKFPKSDEASHALHETGRLHETELLRFEKAIEAYEACTFGPWAGQARQRAAALREKSLSLRTERAFRTDEALRVKLAVRNLEEVRVRVFAIDLETYFRAEQTIERVEDLDIEVIQATRTWQEKTPAFQKYQEIERDLELPLTGPGAWIVKVDQGDLEATALALSTDLVLLTRATRQDLVVYAENARTGTLVADLPLLVSDGRKVLFEGRTDARGLFHRRAPELAGASDVTVFGAGALGVAATGLSIGGLSSAVGLQEKGYLFTDRTAYEPGDEVAFHAVLRDVADGRYTFEEGRRWAVELLAPEAGVVERLEVPLTAFGSLSTTHRLDPSAAHGTYVIRVRSIGEEPRPREHQTSFEVTRTEVDRFRLAIDLDEPVIFRGEPIAGRVRASWFHGGVAAERAIHVDLVGVARVSGRTDARGEFAFSFPTEELFEERTLTIAATLSEESVSTARPVQVARIALALGVSTLREVVTAGEPFDAEVTLRDRVGEKIGGRVDLQVLRLVDQRGTRVERLVERHELEVTKDAGNARRRLSLAEGGSYRLRASSTDRFGNQVSAVRELFVSGDEDEVKLRLLADADTLKSGAAARVRVVSRLEPTRVLVAHVGDGILHYEVRPLPRGESELAFDVDPSLAPNFALALCAASGTTWHEAVKDFRVARDLAIEIQPDPATACPGQEVGATIRVVDPAGRPVRTELTLAVVDEAHLARYPDATPSIVAFFEGQRSTDSTAGSSCAFAYRAQTRRVAAALLAEQERLLVEEARREAERGLDAAAPRLGTRLALGRETSGRPGAPPGGGGGQFRGRADMPAQTLGGLQQQAEQSGEDAAGFYFANDLKGDARARKQLRYGFAQPGDDPGAPPEPRADFRPTAFFAAAVVTDDEGRARVAFPMPDSTTSWAWRARGITAATLVGEGRATSITRLDLGVDLQLPAHLIEGDEGTVFGLARNASGAERAVDLALRASGALASGEVRRSARVADGSEEREALRVRATGPGEGRIRVEASSGELGDALERPLVIHPYASDVLAVEGGVAGDDVSLVLRLPAGAAILERSLRLDLAANTDRALIDLALGVGGHEFQRAGCVVVPDVLRNSITRGLAALEVLLAFEGRPGANPEGLRRLRLQVERAVAHATAAQLPDGGFDWVGAGGARRGPQAPTSDLVESSRAFTLLARAARHGFDVSEAVRTKAQNYLEQQLRTRPEQELKARAAAALSWHVELDFAILNRLERFRSELDPISLAHVGHAFLNLGRREKGLVFATEALARVARDRTGAWIEGVSGRPGLDDTLEATASVLHLLARLDERNAVVAELERWVRGRWLGRGFGTERGTSAAFAALSVLAARSEARGDSFSVEARLGERVVGRLEVPSAEEHRTITLGNDVVTSDEVRLTLAFRGRGSYRYTATLEGRVRGYDARQRDAFARLERRYLRAPLRHAGKPISDGFSTVDEEETWRHETTEVGHGGSVLVEVRYTLPTAFAEATGDHVLEEPIPAGTSVQPGSLNGNFTHVQASAGRLLVFLPTGVRAGILRYELLGTLPGSYRALPTRLWPYTHPERVSIGQEVRFRVLGRDDVPTVTHRMTPDELYHLGKAHYDAGEKDRALELLESLLQGFRVKDAFHKEAARMIFLVALEKNDAGRIVNGFEVLKERYPSLVLGFDQMMRVGDAYLAMSEEERASEVLRGIAEASFLREVGVAGTLEQQGRFLASIDFLRRLVREYPDLPVVLSTAARIPQLVYSRSAQTIERDGKRLTRNELLAIAGELSQDFLVAYPESRIADEVAFGRVSALMERERFDGVVETSSVYASLYGESSYLDDLLYMDGYARFALGDYDTALRTLDRVRSEKFKNERGELTQASHLDLATHMIGQIHHARRRFEEAIQAYGVVRKEFSDADLAIRQLERRELALPEVTSVAPGAPATLKLESRNLAKASLRVYRVDLVRLYLLQKSLDEMTGIKLSGITPTHAMEVELGPGVDYRARTQEVTLPLPDRGAYLVVAQAGENSAAGMLIRTDLELEILTEVETGLVRVDVHTRAGEPVAKAHVKVVGSGNGEFRSADTDLRGIATLENVSGRATVVVQEGDRVAFYRGRENLQGAVPQRSEGQYAPKNFKEEAERRLRSMNKALQDKGGQELEGLMRQRQTGVEVQRAVDQQSNWKK